VLATSWQHDLIYTCVAIGEEKTHKLKVGIKIWVQNQQMSGNPIMILLLVLILLRLLSSNFTTFHPARNFSISNYACAVGTGQLADAEA
jgi:hypothetical protein